MDTPADPTREEWEQLRRSIAMLPTGSWAMKREPALKVLSTLITQLRSPGNS